MTPEEHIAALQRELIETRNAVISIMLGMAEGIARTAHAREELAKGFQSAAEVEGVEEVTARLARLMAAALRT